MLSGKIVVRRQPLPVLQHRLDRLGVVRKGLLEFLSLPFNASWQLSAYIMAVRCFFASPWSFLLTTVDHVEHLVIPAQLLLGLGIDLTNRCPQPQVAIPDK